MEQQRSCGECSACCFTHSVAVGGVSVTEMGSWCQHCTSGSGCGIYATRPPSCRTYECMWRRGLLKEELRPDRYGVIFDYWTIPGEAYLLMNLWEVTPGRLASPEVQHVIAAVIRSGKTVIVCRPLNDPEQQELCFPSAMNENEKVRFVNAAVEYMRSKQYEEG